MDDWTVVQLVVVVAAFGAMVWAFALDRITGRWQAFLAVPLWLVMLLVSLGLLLTGRLPLPVAVPLLAFAVVAPKVAWALESAVEPLARWWRSGRADDQRLAFEDQVAGEQAALETLFVEPLRVEAIESTFLRLERGFPLRLELSVPDDRWADFEAAARDTLVGRQVIVTLAPHFQLAYAGRSAVTDRWRRLGGEGTIFRDIPASVALDGRVLRGWRDGGLWWEPAAPPPP